MLIDIDIFELKVIVFDVIQKQLVINNYNVTTSLFITLKKKHIKRKLQNRKQIIILTHIVITIFVKYCDKILLNNRNYSFLFRFNIALESSNNFFAYIVNANIDAI